MKKMFRANVGLVTDFQPTTLSGIVRTLSRR
nr:MAG TPA: hypothetical protein [Bacteriophage sp.]